MSKGESDEELDDGDAETGDEGLTTLLDGMRNGDTEARDRFYARIYGSLHRYARWLTGDRKGHTLQPTALVNEAWLRVASSEHECASHAHLLARLAKAMRHAVIDYERTKSGLRRTPTGERVELDDIHAQFQERAHDLVRLDAALDALARSDPRLVQLIELRFFAGLGVPESADALGVSPRTLSRDYERARRWIFHHMQGEGNPAPPA